MTPDYPAAHSMDTQFFAIDERGQVAVFDTSENGHAPEAALSDSEGDIYHLSEMILGEDHYHSSEQEAYQLNLFYFAYDDGFDPIGVYHRQGAPETPMHFGQLPPALRAQAARVKLAVRFDAAEMVQPLEEYACTFWYSDRVAYVCADGKTVRPIPGQEKLFADFVRTFRREWPQEAEQYRFEGPSE